MSDEEVFSNSPKPSGRGSVPATPLQSYLRDQKTIRLQRLAEERKNRLLETQSDLDIANCQNDVLSTENGQLRREVERLKVQLEDVKSKLFSMPENVEEVENLKEQNRRLRYSIAEQKDTEKYLKDIEKRLEASINENRDYENRQAALQQKLKEHSCAKVTLSLQVDELRVTLQNVENQNATLQETVEELQKEVDLLRNLSTTKKPIHSAKIGDFFIGDISVDDPQISPNASNVDSGCDEVIGNNLILDLKEDVERLTEELEREKEMKNQEIEKSEFLERKVSELEEEAEKRKQEMETFIKTKAAELEKASLELNREKERSSHEMAKNSYLEERISSLQDDAKMREERISELELEKSKLTEELNAELEKNSNLTENVSRLQNAVQEKEKQMAEVNEEKGFEIEKLNLELVTEREKNVLLSGMTSNLQNELIEKEEQLLNLKKEISQEIETLGSEVNSHKEKLSEEVSRNKSLSEEISVLQKEMEEKVSRLTAQNFEEVAKINSEKESNGQLRDQVASLEIVIAEKEKQILDLMSEKNEAVERVSFELQQLRTANEDLVQKLSKSEAELQGQSKKFENASEALQRKINECETLTSQIASAEVEKNWALTEKVTKLENQVLAQESTIKEQAEMMKSQALEFEQAVQKLLSERNVEGEKLDAKIAQLKNQVKAREHDNDKLMELLHSKAVEFEKLTRDFERECEMNKIDLQKNFGSDFEKQKQLFESEVFALKSKISELERLRAEQQSETKMLCESRAEVARELADCRKSLEELQHSIKRESLENSKKVSDLQQCHKKAMQENENDIKNLKEALQKTEDENAQLKQEFETLPSSSQEVEKKIEQIKEECKKSKDEALAEQKSRYEARLIHVKEVIKSQYKEQIEKSITMWSAEVRAKDEKFFDCNQKLEAANKEAEKLKSENSELAGKYEVAKQKIVEISEQMESKENLLSSEKLQLLTKYEAAKKVVLDLKERLKGKDNEIQSLKNHNEQLKKELAATKSEPHPVKTSSDGFKHPGSITVSTPGRARVGRTQSEAAMQRRPPSGVGPLFAAHDETGEEFSSNYLNDLKEGRCANQSTSLSRISELSRRNSMVPAHLKSSYPAETQFHDQSDFTDDDLRLSRISMAPADAQSLRRESAVSNVGTDRRQSTVSVNSYSLRRQTLSNISPSSKTSSVANVIAGAAKTSSTDLKRKPSGIDDETSIKRLRKDVENEPAISTPVTRRSERKLNETFNTTNAESPAVMLTPSSKKQPKTPSSLRKILAKARLIKKSDTPSKSSKEEATAAAPSPRSRGFRLRK